MYKNKWLAYIRLMRLDKPIGVFLLLWPTLWALWISSKGIPSLDILLVFICGVIIMRSAGCVINDYADRHLDGAVTRTKNRPFPSRIVTEGEAKTLFTVLILIAFLFVLALNTFTIVLSFLAVIFAWFYPLMKRFTYLPQFFLGIAFGWSIPMAYAATIVELPLSCWLLFLANIFWTIAYDTEYAMVDRDDDMKNNIKSTAILFGKADINIIGIFQSIMLVTLIIVAYLNHLSAIFYFSVIIAAVLFIEQQRLLVKRTQSSYFLAFKNNNHVGLIVFLGILFSYL